MDTEKRPYLIEVDPQRIRFNKLNPRRHQGVEFLRLEQSIEALGQTQFPTVRDLPGGFHECIDGEGRIRVSQKAKRSKIWVINLGSMTEQEAQARLQASNAVRSFSYVAECIGLANLYRGGQTQPDIARSMGMSTPAVTLAIHVGSFPAEVHNLIQEHIWGTALNDQEEARNITWSPKVFQALLPLRIRVGASIRVRENQGSTLDARYDYTEVHLAVKKLVSGEINTYDKLVAYVERRQRELFEQHFNQELRLSVEEELAQTKRALEEDYSQQLKTLREEEFESYEAQVKELQDQYDDLDKRHQAIIREVAKRPEIIKKREEELKKKTEEMQAERRRLQTLQRQVDKDAEIAKQQLQQEMDRKLKSERLEQQQKAERELHEHKRRWEDYYADQDKQRQIDAEETVGQSVAYGIGLMSKMQQWLLLIRSPDFVKGLGWLSDSEVAGLIHEMRVLRESLGLAENAVGRGEILPQAVEGSLANGRSPSHSN